MAQLSIFDIAGRAMSAQLVRLNTTASNLANAGTVAGSAADAYRARKPVFQTFFDKQSPDRATVDVARVVTTSGTPQQQHMPGHPLADAQGNVWTADVDANMEMVEMLEASRQYQNNVEVMQTAKTLILSTLKLGQ
jgi:flagellar basal-body rod protein FlgC